MRPSRPAAIAVIVGSLAAVGCLNTEPKEPMGLGTDARAALGGSKAAKPASFDPSAAGGSGGPVPNAFNRSGTGSKTGDFASKLPQPQIGQQPAAVAPTISGASYGEPMSDQGRSSMTTRSATPAAIPPVAPPSPPAGGVAPMAPVGGSPFAEVAPKLGAPLNDPPVKPAVGFDSTPPAPPKAIPPVMPDADRGSLPVPVIPGGPAAPVPPAAPLAPGAAANDSLPLPPAGVPSASEVPAPGLQAAPKLPPPPPLPNR